MSCQSLELHTPLKPMCQCKHSFPQSKDLLLHLIPADFKDLTLGSPKLRASASQSLLSSPRSHRSPVEHTSIQREPQPHGRTCVVTQSLADPRHSRSLEPDPYGPWEPQIISISSQSSSQSWDFSQSWLHVPSPASQSVLEVSTPRTICTRGRAVSPASPSAPGHGRGFVPWRTLGPVPDASCPSQGHALTHACSLGGRDGCAGLHRTLQVRPRTAPAHRAH